MFFRSQICDKFVSRMTGKVVNFLIFGDRPQSEMEVDDQVSGLGLEQQRLISYWGEASKRK